MNNTKIDWADATWNPVTGCNHNCPYCYARKIAYRFCGKGSIDMSALTILNRVGCYELKKPALKLDGTIAPYPFAFMPTFHFYKLEEPQHWKKPKNIFVCSMADLFGAWVPDRWFKEIFAACEKAPQHNYMFLTKNPEMYNRLAERGILPQKHWYGYSATRQSELWRFKHADECRVKNLFVSVEPVLEEMKPGFCSHCPADWVIIGAETGNRKDKVIPKREWIENIVTECEYAGIPIFMKASLAKIWGEPLIQQFPDSLRKEKKYE